MPSASLRKTVVAYALGLWAATAPSAFVGDWTSYSDLSAPTCLLVWQGEIWAGTPGGVRRVSPVPPWREIHYTNMQGLLDVDIAGLTVDAEGKLWAAGHSGQLFRFEGERWSAWGKSYRSAGWTINPRAVAAAGRYIIIGSKQGLSLFDRTTGLAAVNLTKFANLGQQPITGVLPVGDTLYIATGKAALKAPVDWDNALSTRFKGTLYDPAIWRPADNLAPLPDFVSAKDSGDTTITTPDQDSARALENARPVEFGLVDGRPFAHDTGTILVTPYPVRALQTRPVAIEGRLASGDARFVAAASLGSSVALAGPNGLFLHTPGPNGGLGLLPARSPLPERTLHGAFAKPAAVAASGGRGLILTGNGVYDVVSGARTLSTPNLREVYTNELRSLTALPNGTFLAAGWGYGLIRVEGPGKVTRWTGENSCITDVLPGFTVFHSMSDPRGNDVWLTQLDNVESRDSYAMVHLDLATGTVSCPDLKGDSYRTLATRILADTLFAVAGPKGIRVYRFGIGGVKANIQRYGSLKGGSGDDFGRDMAMDGYGRMWALMNGKVGYVDSLADKVGPDKTPEVAYLDGFPGKNCAVMEPDARQSLWIGCENGLYHIAPTDKPAEPRIVHYDSEDGLLGDLVTDLSMDRSNGKLWVVTEHGVNVFQSEAKPQISGTAGVKAYPNPFREKHRMVVIDNVPKGATGAIFTQSGNAVRRFASRDARGNQFQWDGTNEEGRKVKPGVYLYSVSAPSGSARGKIIVAR